MKIAVVILNWNGKSLLEKFIPSIIKHSKGAEIIVADNNSDDDSVSFLENNHPEVRIIKNKVNGGYAKGYNDSLKEVDADVFALVNSDIEVSENWLEPVKKIFENNTEIAAIQPKILDYKNKKKFEFAGAAGGHIDMLGYPYCKGRIFTEIEENKGQYDEVSDIFWASGACLFIKADIYRQLEGFDEDYFAHMEEIDLCWRVHNIGKRIVYAPESIVYHVGGATLKESNPRKTFLNFRNSLFTVLKNAPKKRVPFLIFARLVLDGVAGVKFIFDGMPIHTLAILKSHFSFYKNFFKMLRKRRNLPHAKKDYYIHKSVVFQFFLLRRKFFRDLK